MQIWYAPLISDGEYLVIKAGVSNDIKEQKNQRKMGYTFAAMGGGIRGAQLAALRFLYVIDESMPGILKTREDLLQAFNKETEMTQDVYIRYLKRLNG
ncbi:DUF6563 family protein [Formosa undariae]|uniref:DUF6563 family protein n=1 Tax=Formosa undariae TaxID=1325436 RepID=A0ABV5F3A4_9FLAO